MERTEKIGEIVLFLVECVWLLAMNPAPKQRVWESTEKNGWNVCAINYFMWKLHLNAVLRSKSYCGLSTLDQHQDKDFFPSLLWIHRRASKENPRESKSNRETSTSREWKNHGRQTVCTKKCHPLSNERRKKRIMQIIWKVIRPPLAHSYTQRHTPSFTDS